MPESAALAPASGGSEKFVLLFKVQVFFSCVSFSIIVPSIAPYLARLGAEPYVLGVAVAVYSLGEMIGSAVFGRAMTVAMRCDPGDGPRKALVTTIMFGIVGSALYVIADMLGRCADGSRARAFAPWCIVLGRLLAGVWTGGKMVVEQTYVGEAAHPDRVTALTSEIGVYAVLGFVIGPSIGAILAPLDFELGGVRVDGYTAPGYFILLACFGMAWASYASFDPAIGYAAVPAARDEEVFVMDGAELGGFAPFSPRRAARAASPPAPLTPDSLGLATCLVCFFAHFYSFAIQETITTPFVAAKYEWSQREIDYLFAGVSVLSLATSLAAAQLARCFSDVALLLLSLSLGLAGSLILLDAPLAPPLDRDRFLVGFALITVAFPFGRNVSLSIFSKILGPTPQGSWMGLMFVVGALPRCLGPSWSLYALQLACEIYHPPGEACPPGGRTFLEFSISALAFALCLALVLLRRSSLKPYDAAAAAAKTSRRDAFEMIPSELPDHT